MVGKDIWYFVVAELLSEQPTHRSLVITVDSNPTLLDASLGPALVGVVREDWASQNSIALSWSEVEQPPADIVDYEVKYYERVKYFLSYKTR